jgi:hypothetical protein
MKHHICEGMFFCKPAETIVNCKNFIQNKHWSFTDILYFILLWYCTWIFKFMHIFWNFVSIIQIQTFHVTTMWFSSQNNCSTECGAYTPQYSCNSLALCRRDGNLVWKSLQRKMFFSRLHLNGNTHLKPKFLVPPTLFDYVSTHNMNTELYDQHYIIECFVGVKVSHIESESLYHPLQKQLIHCVVVCNIGISYTTSFQTLYVGPTVNVQPWAYQVFGFLQLPSIPKRTQWAAVCLCFQMKVWGNACLGGWVKFMPHFFTW